MSKSFLIQTLIKLYVVDFPVFYIGVTDMYTHRTWRKATTFGRQNFMYWYRGQPDNSRGAQHCVRVYVDGMAWDDIDCSAKNHFICEK